MSDDHIEVKSTLISLIVKDDTIKLIPVDHLSLIQKQVDQLVEIPSIGTEITRVMLKNTSVLGQVHALMNNQAELLHSYTVLKHKATALLTKYYSGKLEASVYVTYGRFDEKLTKDDVQKHVALHPIFQRLDACEQRLDRTIKYLECVINDVSYNRVKSCTAILDYEKFLAGR